MESLKNTFTILKEIIVDDKRNYEWNIQFTYTIILTKQSSSLSNTFLTCSSTTCLSSTYTIPFSESNTNFAKLSTYPVKNYFDENFGQ